MPPSPNSLSIAYRPFRAVFRRATGSDTGALRDQTEVNIRERTGRRKQKAVTWMRSSYG